MVKSLLKVYLQHFQIYAYTRMVEQTSTNIMCSAINEATGNKVRDTWRSYEKMLSDYSSQSWQLDYKDRQRELLIDIKNIKLC